MPTAEGKSASMGLELLLPDAVVTSRYFAVFAVISAAFTAYALISFGLGIEVVGGAAALFGSILVGLACRAFLRDRPDLRADPSENAILCGGWMGVISVPFTFVRSWTEGSSYGFPIVMGILTTGLMLALLRKYKRQLR